ncbi:DUF4178 domain-containing protein [Novosphingobium naphthalenivorans]|uniref:DUF4178 domain-containing protein n=1 Tax=Novosphingobium naphthalenivorans TaxID=273168 RepID=UPI0008327D89|nr:DUF4178 domain-containing protein [Novosphingobium naphthalenivorans]
MINCPSCGAALPVRGFGVPYTTCHHCQALILRQGQSVEMVGKVAVVPDDISPVQIGTRFRLGAEDFVAAGRVRWAWSGGSWNEWLLFSAAGRSHWLGEAMGMYMLTAECPDALVDPQVVRFAQGADLAVGQTISSGTTRFAVTDIKRAECLGGEGDLPFPAHSGRTMTNVDLRGPSGEALSLQRDAEGTSAWLGTWHELADLNPSSLRELEGWSLPSGFPGARA